MFNNHGKINATPAEQIEHAFFISHRRVPWNSSLMYFFIDPQYHYVMPRKMLAISQRYWHEKMDRFVNSLRLIYSSSLNEAGWDFTWWFQK